MSARPKADNLPLPPLPDKKYDVVSIDWPWHFYSRAATANPESDRNAQRHYPTMDLDYIKAFPLKQLLKPDALVFMWMTGPLEVDGVHAMLFRHWGLRPSAKAFTWVKVRRGFDMQLLHSTPLLESDLHVGTGFTTRKNTEVVYMARRGSGIPRARADIREVIFAPVTEHSRKPVEYFRRAEAYTRPDVDRLDMFAGEPRPGWDSYGWSHRDGERPESAVAR